jgi:hypothetical protein
MVEWVFGTLRNALPLIIGAEDPVLKDISRLVKVNIKMSHLDLGNRRRRQCNARIRLGKVPGCVAASRARSERTLVRLIWDQRTRRLCSHRYCRERRLGHRLSR